MRWVVGIDLRNLAGGAVAFARWLADQVPQDRFSGVHVVEYVPHLFVENDGAGSVEEVRAVAERALAPLQTDERFGDLEAVLATAAEDGLRAAIDEQGAQVVVLGRRAPRAGGTVVRLGRVCRRVLRALPCTVVVVPPDLEAIGDGPIVVATDLGDDSVPAARWASTLAAALGRPWILAYAREAPDQLHALLGADEWDAMEGRHRVQGQAELEAWALRHRFDDVERLVIEGAPVAALPKLAAERDACLLVAGSRRLGGLDRLFLSSVGSELAAVASLAVAVVPPPASIA